tara:strand:- start:73 stop:294 length:222 start_codon:yes stop_codon:yes gene_type:complete
MGEGDYSMANIMENKPFLLFVAIMQPVIYFISLEYFGEVVAVAIPWSIFILYIIWLKLSGKGIFRKDKPDEEA